ncbi:MAG: transcriptional regulator, MerR family [Actinomycetia bacterium]|nr:transcriptional regulator, MerR family [Actinomycetes bacterium]
MDELRLDDLARAAGVATTTVRLYQSKGLLPPPRLVGRTGWYDETHLARLRLIAKLQDDGHSLAGIGKLLTSWEEGRDLADVAGVERELDALLGRGRPVVLDPGELAARLPAIAMSGELVQRAAALGLVELTDDGRFRVPDQRFLEAGAALTQLGIPAEAVLDEWEHLVGRTDELAERFVSLFERHLRPRNWRKLDAQQTAQLAETLHQLQRTAAQVVDAALDASIARLARERLGKLAD